LSSDIYSAVLHGTALTLVVCDNGGYGVISRLQSNNGANSFRTMITENENAPRVDFQAHAKSMGASTHLAKSANEVAQIVAATRNSKKVEVIVIETAPAIWSEGGAFWEVGVADEFENSESIEMKDKQRKF